MAWAKNVYFLDGTTKVKHPNIGTLNMDFIVKQVDIFSVMPACAIFMLAKNEISLSNSKNAAFTNRNIETKLQNRIIQDINNFDLDIIDCGAFERNMTATPTIETDDINLLINLSENPDIGDRAVWIMNTTVMKEYSFRTVKALGNAYYKNWVFDKAKEKYLEACNLGKAENIPQAEVLHIENKIKIVAELEILVAMP